MQLKTFKPITPSLRHRQLVPSIPHDPFKPLVVGKASPGFRNNRGRVTIRHRGGGHKRNLRLVDFLSLNSSHSPFEVLRWDYDPTRSAYLALCRTLNNSQISLPIINNTKAAVWINKHKYFYILATDSVTSGSIIYPRDSKLGNTLPLKSITIGSEIHNIELNPGKGAKFTRAAGSSSILLGMKDGKAIIQLPSKEVKEVGWECKATIGRVANPQHNLTRLGKAGASRWLGRRPTVRGEVMNPIDHPHGGKTRGGRPLKNIWGKLAKWVPTKKNK